MFQRKLTNRLLIAAGAILVAALACSPGETPPPLPTPTTVDLPTEAPTEPAAAPGGETCATNPPDPSIPDAAGWQLYCDEVRGFAFRYPAGGSPGGGAGHGSIYLPFTAGTNIAEKYISVVFQEGATVCQSPNAEGYELGSIPSETASINGVDWYKQSGSNAGAGNFYDWVGYSYLRGEACLSLTFIIHSNNPGVFETPPAEYDPAVETAVYNQVMATLLWPE